MPLPEVIWYRNGLLVDATYELVGNNYAANELNIVHLERNHSHDLYTCQASNNNETKPISHRVNLDVYCKSQITNNYFLFMEELTQPTQQPLESMLCSYSLQVDSFGCFVLCRILLFIKYSLDANVCFHPCRRRP